jgi:hypothetical protein
VPTHHDRVQVTLDPELAERLAAVGDLVPGRGRAGIMRELALRGARATLEGDQPAATGRRWVPVAEVAAALAAVPPVLGLLDDIRGLPGELADPFA